MTGSLLDLEWPDQFDPIDWSHEEHSDYLKFFPYPSDIPDWLRAVPPHRALVLYRGPESPRFWSGDWIRYWEPEELPPWLKAFNK